ncbi:MAG: peptidase MA family metallohydrolase [Armatimonadota bacterium]
MKIVPWIIAALLCVVSCVYGSDRYSLQTDHFRLYYPPQRTEKAEVVANALEGALDPLSHAMDVELQGRVRVELFETRTAMFEAANLKIKPGVMGLALPSRNTILLGIVADTPLERTAVHELAHLVLYEKFGRDGIVSQPRWLHEGFAQLGAGELTASQRTILGDAAVGGQLMRLDELEEAFSGDSAEVGLAYAQSFTLVQYLNGLRPRGGLAQFVENLSLTGNQDRAFIRTYGKTRAEIEEEWLKQIRSRYLEAGLPHWTEAAIFGSMVLVFIVALIVQNRRRTAIRERLAEEEEQKRELEPVGDDEGAGPW